jgi:hypothetical protein
MPCGPRRVIILSLDVVVMGLMTLVFEFLNPPEVTLWWDALFDLGHVLLFFFVFGLILDCSKRLYSRTDPGRRLAGSLAVTIALAAVSEWQQQWQATRDPSLGDFLRDVTGACLFLLVFGHEALARQPPWFSTRLRLLVGAGLVTAVLVPFAMVTNVYVQRRLAFPTLVRMDGSHWEGTLMTAGGAHFVPTTLAHSAAVTGLARLDLEAVRYPGLTFDEPYPDWRGFRQLVFSAASKDVEPIAMRIRIHDRNHGERFDDRFNSEITLTNTVQSFAIPLEVIRNAPAGRKMDMANIRGIGFYALHLAAPSSIYIGAFHLE